MMGDTFLAIMLSIGVLAVVVGVLAATRLNHQHDASTELRDAIDDLEFFRDKLSLARHLGCDKMVERLEKAVKNAEAKVDRMKRRM